MVIELNKRVTFPSLGCDLHPTAKQALFLAQQDEKEVFFGGAAGGGKSVALLMGALEYMRFPGYAALIIRKDFARLELAGGLIPRSQELFREVKNARWIASRRQWVFSFDFCPSSTIMFGYMSRPLDKFRYASSEYQYIAFDELTDFSEEEIIWAPTYLAHQPVSRQMFAGNHPPSDRLTCATISGTISVSHFPNPWMPPLQSKTIFTPRSAQVAIQCV